MSSTDTPYDIAMYLMRDKNAVIYNNNYVQYTGYGSEYGNGNSNGFRGGNKGCPDGNGIARAYSANDGSWISITN